MAVECWDRLQAVVVIANMVESQLAGGGCHERGSEDHGVAPVPDRDRLHSTVNDGAGPGSRRVDRASVWAGGRSGSAGLASRQHRGDRHRFGGVGPVWQRPRRVPGDRGPGVSGRGRGGVRAGGVAAGSLVGGVHSAVGVGPADRHAGHRCRWCLRPGRFQRPVVCWG
jgi:hypothetical protein